MLLKSHTRKNWNGGGGVGGDKKHNQLMGGRELIKWGRRTILLLLNPPTCVWSVTCSFVKLITYHITNKIIYSFHKQYNFI